MNFGKPAAWSIGLGVGLPVLGWLSGGAPSSAADILSLIVIIPLWALFVRGLIFVGQRLLGRPSSN